MDPRLEQRAKTPRYSFREAAELVERPTNTVRRWSVGNRRRAKERAIVDEPLISIDGDIALPLSFLNLLELRMLSRYRNGAPLQAIRRALDFAAGELKEPRPLLTVQFRVHGGELFTRFAESPGGKELLLNATRGGQITFEELIRSVTDEIDYENDTAHRWWFRSRRVPVLVDTRVAAGHPITAETGVRVDAILSRSEQGYKPKEIAADTGATPAEVAAVLQLRAA